MFNRARNVVVNGGQLTSILSNTKGGFQILQDHVGTSAFHNSAQRVDPPRCYEGTRKAVLQEIFEWIVQDAEQRATRIAWLHGAAGAGKSAIGQSLAELCITHGVLVASFFFFQTDPLRSTVSPLVATLAYQIILLIPPIKEIIINAVELNPLIFKQSFATQLDELIIKPLRILQLSNSNFSIVFIIDGIDECLGDENQREVIHTFAKLLAINDCPIIVLFSSRADNHLKSTFRAPHVAKLLLQLPLDDHYQPEEDIRRFLDATFADIKERHSLSHLLDADWPPEPIVQEIVDKSSGQFIYASVVMKFVSFPCAHPAHQLDIIRGLRPSHSATPFTHLDVLYRHIFSKVRDLKATTDVLAYVILGNGKITWNIAYFFDIPEADVFVALSELTSVVVCEYGRVRFLHASLPDFLLDQTRSQEYYINPVEWGTRLALMWLENAEWRRFIVNMVDSTICNFLARAEPTSALREAILAFDPYTCPKSVGIFGGSYLTAVQKLDFGDGCEAYRLQLTAMARYFRNYLSRAKSVALLEGHDVSAIMAEIDREEAEKEAAKELSKRTKKRERVVKLPPSEPDRVSELSPPNASQLKHTNDIAQRRRSRRLMLNARANP